MLRVIEALIIIAVFSLLSVVTEAQTLSGKVIRLSPTSVPSVCSTGDLRVDTGASDALRICRANSWVSFIDTGTAFISPLTTNGDLITQAAGAVARLAVGSANTVLRSSGTAPAWGQVVSGDLAGSIDATKIADGSVTSTEFQYIGTLTSDAQTQLTTGANNLTTHEADTSTHGVTTVAGLSETQALSNKTVGLSDGTVSAPSLHFTGDTDNGLFRVGANNWEAVVGGINALDFKVSTGGYANIGFAGTAASTGDGVPFYLKRDQVTSTAFRIDNANTNANAASIVQFNGNGYNAYVFGYSSANTNSGLGAKIGLWSITGTGTSLVASSGSGTHGMYIGGAADANKIAEVTADGLNLLAEGELRFQDTTGGQYVSLKAPGTVASSVSFTLPDADGLTGQVLSTDGAGVLDWSDGGSGTGKNYAQDLYSGLSVTGINRYDDGASATPVDGTAGTTGAISAAALEVSAPLRGTSSQRLSKTAADGQGEGWSYDFTVDTADYEGSKPLIISFNYKTSANYAADDVRVFVYDKDGAALLNVIDMQGDGSLGFASNTTKFVGSFNTVSTSDDYRLILHVTSTNASAWDLDIIDLSISPEQTVPGAIVTEWESYTPTYTGFGTVSTSAMYWRRNVADLEVRGTFTTGTTTATEGRISFPSGLTSSAAIGTLEVAGPPFGRPVSASTFFFVQPLREASVTYFTFGAQQSTTNNMTKVNANGAFGTGEALSFQASVPISGWAASAALSTTETMMRGAKVRAYSSATVVSGTAANVVWTTEEYDTLNNFDGTTFTAPRTGKYKFAAKLQVGATWTANQNVQLWVEKNASSSYAYGYAIVRLDGSVSGTRTIQSADTVQMNAGDYIRVRVVVEGTSPSITAVTSNAFTVEEVFDPTVFSVYGQFELKTATSSVKTPSATGHYHALTGNSLTLTPGTWKLKPYGKFSTSGGAATYTNTMVGIFAANGADSSSLPAAITTLSNLTVLNAVDTTRLLGWGTITSGGGVSDHVPAPETIVRVTAPVTVYFVTYADMTTAANARITVYANAERLQ